MSNGEVFTIFGTTSGTETSGTLVLRADIWMLSATSGFTNKFRLPYGSKMKIWESKIVGEPVTINVEAAEYGNSTYTTNFWSMGVDKLQTAGQITITREGRPLVIPAPDEKWVAFRYTTTSGGATAYAEFNVEITPNE